MSCITKPSHVVPFRQPVDVVRGVIDRIKLHLTVSAASKNGQYCELLELEAEVTSAQLMKIKRMLSGGE